MDLTNLFSVSLRSPKSRFCKCTVIFSSSFAICIVPVINGLDKLNVLFQKVTFICSDFSTSLQKVKENDFVYLDPPYLPENKGSFVNYTENGFSYENHMSLFNLIKNINCNFLLSNSNSEVIYEQFKDYNIISFDCKRSINSKKPNSRTKEVLVFNY